MRVNSRTVGGALARALEFQQATLELVTERVEAIDQGLVVRHSALPFVWSANHVRITEPVTFAQALELAETHLGDLPYRQLMIEHEPTGRRLERSFAEAGWEVDREVVMRLAREPDRDLELGMVIDADEDSV